MDKEEPNFNIWGEISMKNNKKNVPSHVIFL